MSRYPVPEGGITGTRWSTYTALYLALTVVLSFGFHMFGYAGRVFLPMHVPVLLAGFLVGPGCGFVVGLLSPSLCHLLMGMPPTYAVPLMSMELPIYGLAAGVIYSKMRWNIYVAMIVAMILGRLMFGLGLFVLGMFMELPYTAAFFFSIGGPILTGLPGIVLQLFLIPLVVTAVKRHSR